MSIKALTITPSGTITMPREEQDWREWVSGSTVRNYCLQDPLLDWLELYGKEHGFRRDTERPGYDERTDMTRFVLRQGNRFEQAVVQYLARLATVETIGAGHEDSRSLVCAELTFGAMCDGIELIYQGVLRDAESRTYGSPDLLVRSDVLRRLFPGLLTAEEAAIPAPDLGQPWHYRVVDIKYTTLKLLTNGQLSRCGSLPAYEAQVTLYNRALARLQGYSPPHAYLLGRGWAQRIDGEECRGTSCMERLVKVSVTKPELLTEVDAACDWLRWLRTCGADWVLLPQPSNLALRPNMGHREDFPWHAAKREIAERQEELTLLWQVGVESRNRALAAGVTGWRDSTCTPSALGVNGSKQGSMLQEILSVNQSDKGAPVRPAWINAGREAWHPTPELEFYVDFETVTDVADDFQTIPERGGQPLLFMIGCGHVEAGVWRYRCFTVGALTKAEERRILAAWRQYMEATQHRLAPDLPNPRLIHWSHAEVSFLKTALGEGGTLLELPWYDFLQQVIRAEPVVVRGALDFGLKSLARALYQHGLIETCWGEGPADGLGTMAAAWWCADEAAKRGCRMRQFELMRQVQDYNEVDCRVMMEIVRYLRTHH